MRDRLIELLRVINEDATRTCPRYSTESTLEDCKGCQYDKEDGSCDYAEREADYLLENGVIVPPCKVGDMVYALWETPTLYTETKYVLYSAEVKEIRIKKRNCRLAYNYIVEPLCFVGRRKEYLDEDFGKLIFPTKEEAEKALEGGAGE